MQWTLLCLPLPATQCVATLNKAYGFLALSPDIWKNKSSSELTAAGPPGAGESRERHPLQQLSRGAGKEEFPIGNRLQRITWLPRNMRLKTAWFSSFLHTCTYREAINWLLRRLGIDHLQSETQSHCSSQQQAEGKKSFVLCFPCLWSCLWYAVRSFSLLSFSSQEESQASSSADEFNVPALHLSWQSVEGMQWG